jgi:hypothetical protein
MTGVLERNRLDGRGSRERFENRNHEELGIWTKLL